MALIRRPGMGESIQLPRYEKKFGISLQKRDPVEITPSPSIVLFLNNLTLSTFRHPILQARKGKNNYEKHYNLMAAQSALPV